MTKALMILLLLGAPAFGQAGKAELFGTIHDPSGLPVVRAQVQAELQATTAGFSAAADEHGAYHLLGLPAGEYVLTVEQPGFRTYRQSGLTLRIADQVKLDITLQLGQPSESVSVNGQAPLLETTTGQVGYGVDQSKVETLPLDGRNFFELSLLLPGVAPPAQGSAGSVRGDSRTGARERANDS